MAVAIALSLTAGCGGDGEGAGTRTVAGDRTPDDPPAPEVAILGKGVVSTPAPEFGASLTPDRRALYFNRASPDRSELVVLVAARTNAGWEEPRRASFSGGHRDLDPFVVPDGRRLYFSSDRPSRHPETGGFDTWYVERADGGWGEPVQPGAPLNSDSLEVFVSATRDGVVHFSSRRDGIQRVYRSRQTEGGWSEPEALTFGPVTSAGNPLVGPNGDFLVLTHPGPEGSTDLFLSCRGPAGWSDPTRLPAPINSPFTDFAPGLDPTDGTLLFTSERPGLAAVPVGQDRPPGDLYRSSLRPADLCTADEPS